MKLTASYVNARAKNDAAEFIKESEKRYQDEIYSVAEEIAADENKKIIMLAGPSGSGKTTTAHILRDYLKAMGKHTEVVSLDDFYLDEDKVPLSEEGEPDYETVYSLDIERINKCFCEAAEKGETDIPIFSFSERKRTDKTKKISIKNGGLMIVEGLHALNPLLFESLKKENLYKLYISVNRSIYDDDGNILLSSRQMRLIRRMSRDDIYRGATPQRTFDVWDDVIRGEEKHLYKFKPTADRQITTLHEYEPCIFKKRVLELLSQVSKDSQDYFYVEETIKGLSFFCSIDESAVPQESLIREFIRGGKYE